MAERRSFGPVVLIGLASAGLAAIASNQPWVRGTPTDEGGAGYTATTALDLEPDMPLALAISLVLLAAWGVILVTRARTRRILAGLALLASLGLLLTVAVGARTLPAALRDDFAAVGASRPDVDITLWWGAVLVAALVAASVAILALRFAPSWPEMGSRYDAPSAAEPVAGAPDDLWKAIEQGHDPTDDTAP